MKNKSFKVGDKIVEFGRVYKIFKIKKEKGREGRLKNVLYFKPFFTSTDLGCMECSIPEESVKEAIIRKPANRKKVNEIIDFLTSRKKVDAIEDATDAKEELKKNKLEVVAWVIKSLMKEAKDKEKLTASKKKVLDTAKEMLAQELALSRRMKLVNARDKIDGLL